MPKTKQHLDFHDAFREDVLSGRKTQTRRVIEMDGVVPDLKRWAFGESFAGRAYFQRGDFVAFATCPYSIGEIVSTPFGDARITAIRAERLQDISNKDAIAEGCREGVVYYGEQSFDNPFVPNASNLYTSFKSMWSHLYPGGPKSWESNPAVWAITFEIGENDDTGN